MKEPKLKPAIYTLGHSTRAIEEFVGLLEEFSIRVLADVRTVPKSRHNPQFAGDALRVSLRKHGITYRHFPGLGGLRKATGTRRNAGWRNESFRGYADHMQSEEFLGALEKLVAIAKRKPTVIVCAEAVPWRCHRNLVADALAVRGFRVEHIMGMGASYLHRLTPFAKVRGTKITYPPEAQAKAA